MSAKAPFSKVLRMVHSRAACAGCSAAASAGSAASRSRSRMKQLTRVDVRLCMRSIGIGTEISVS